MRHTQLRRYAPLGLYLSLLAALVSIGLYIVQREWNLLLQASLAAIVLGLAIYTALDPEQVRVVLTGRQARYGSNALVMTLAFVGILVVVNYLVFENPKRWDLTEDAAHTLMAESVETLKSLPANVQALAFYPATINSDQAKTLLDDYKFYSEGKFDYQFIDPIADPVAARQVNVSLETGGTIVLMMGDRQEKVTYASEQEMTGAMVRLMGESLSVYFLTGHGEPGPDEAGEMGYSQVRTILEAKNYTIQSLNLLATPLIPEDAKTLVVAFPMKPVSEAEVDLIDEFLQQGGGLIVMQEPRDFTEFGDAPDPLADYLASNWGMTMGEDTVLDFTTNQPFVAYAAQYDTRHPITTKLQRMVTVFPTARSVRATGAQGAATATELVLTSPQSWAETDIVQLEADVQAGQPAMPEEGVDLVGPVPMVAAAESNGRVVVIGDAEFATNAYFSYYGNGDLLVNSVDWVSEQENLINLTPKEPVQRMLIQPQTVTKGLILLGSVFVPAGLVLASGIMVFVRRRRRG